MYPFIKSCTFFERLWPYGYGHRIHQVFPFFERNPWLPCWRVRCCLSKPRWTKTQINKVKTQINKNHNPQTRRHAHNYKDKILEPKPKTQPSFFQQLHREKTQKHSTITQRQNLNPDFSASNTKLNLDFLRLSEEPNTKLKTQIPNQWTKPKIWNHK